MQADAALIEEIVGRVLRELGTPAGGSARPAEAAVAATEAEPQAVSIAAHVVTRESLESLTGPVRTIRVGPKAILTPSARDYIRHKGLAVLRETKAAARAAVAAWMVVVSHSTPQVTGAIEALRSSGVGFESHLSGIPQEAASLATTALCRGEAAGIVVISNEPELVACLANRNDRIRAAVVSDVRGLDRVRGRFQPNLLAVDPVGPSLFELRQLLKTIVTAGANVARES